MSEAWDQKNCEVLILGGTGFIGRNLVKYLVDNKLAKFIRVADKSMPATSCMHPLHEAAFANKELVEFKQADLAKDPHVERAFADHHFNVVINLCGETRFGCSEEDYKQKCLTPAEKCAAAAVKNKVDKWIEVSCARVYDAGKKPSNEAAKLKPWTHVATYRLKAEEVLLKTAGLNVTVIRPAIVYGLGDLTGLTPRILCAVVYAVKKEKMKFLWDKDLLLNTVHVDDVCPALWAAATTAKPGSIYNLADSGNTSQGDLNTILGEMFGIETGFLGSMLSNMAKLQLASVATEANDKHVPGWAEVCSEHKINITPLSPYIDKELLYNNSLTVDGSAISKDLGVTYKHPTLTKGALVQVVKGFEEQGIFPKGFLKA